MSSTKSIHISNDIIVSITTLLVGTAAIIYAKANNKNQGIAGIAGTTAGTIIGKLITKNS